MVFLVIFCLVAWGSSLVAQQPALKIMANSADLQGDLVLKGTQRIVFMVSDGMPAESGYAYEFGPLYLVSPTGDMVELHGKSVENRPIFFYSLRASNLEAYPQGFKLRLEGITRHNPNSSSERLPFKAGELEINVVPE